nr:GNAT family N-acetyltransferase [Enterococcus sp. DIV0212c]
MIQNGGNAVLLKELTLADEQRYSDFINEWIASGVSQITPTSANLNGLTFQEWLNKLKKDKSTINNSFVPADTLFLEVEGKLVGAVQLRYELTDKLLQIGGNIGYGIVPSERRKGYANWILAQALLIFHKRGFSKVMLTCDKKNIGSQKTIQKNGGILSDEYLIEGEMIQRYWIEL